MRGLGLCRLLLDSGVDAPPSSRLPIVQAEKIGSSRRRIFRSREEVDGVPIICDGWIAVAAYLPNGRRQILSLGLPGDLLSVGTLFESRVNHDVEALTPVRYRLFDRVGLRENLLTSPKALSSFVTDCAEEVHRLNERVLDLGRRQADQRIARLILELMERLTSKRATPAQTFNFPLRQSQIADVTGLTAAYVNHVLKSFRTRGLIKFEKRSLTVLDATKLRWMVDQ